MRLINRQGPQNHRRRLCANGGSVSGANGCPLGGRPCATDVLNARSFQGKQRYGVSPALSPSASSGPSDPGRPHVLVIPTLLDVIHSHKGA